MNIATATRFMRDVKMEATKVAWPTLADTRTMTIMVFILVVAVAVYLMVVDMLIGTSINWLLGM